MISNQIRRRATTSHTSLLSSARTVITTTEGCRPTIVHKRSLDVLQDPWFNKGTAFSITERDRLNIRGLLPPNVMSPQQQIDRFMVDLQRLQVQARDGKSDTIPLAKWRILNRLHDRNETMYYRILLDNIAQYSSIVYTPTAGRVCQNYSGLFRRPRGMFFSAADRGEMMSMVYNWPAEQVHVIVLTDGSSIMGLGDLGVQGIGMAIGKLDLYVAAAGINPQRVLPIMIDVGTNNEKLLGDPWYLGLQERRLDGDEYVSIIDELMEAIFTRWPKVIVQFEGFQSKWALELLQRYRNVYRMFNDDIQGTAGVAIAGILGTLRSQNRPVTDFPKLKIVVAGAGKAGIGFINAASSTMDKMLEHSDDSGSCNKSKDQIWVVDDQGLITEERRNVHPDVVPFTRKCGNRLKEGANLAEVVGEVKPDVLIGLSDSGGLFTKEVLTALKGHSDCDRRRRPTIFAMSYPNPECSFEEAYSVMGEKMVFATGNRMRELEEGGDCNQMNNMYLFPGIGLGALVSGSKVISDGMIQRAAECLAEYTSEEEVREGILYPEISKVRDITEKVAAAVVKEAVEEDVAEGYRGRAKARELQRLDDEEILEYVKKNMWTPHYSKMVFKSK
ncbi:NAD-dependent malic enzyme 1, mitochondrial [Linum grandiflorum]